MSYLTEIRYRLDLSERELELLLHVLGVYNDGLKLDPSFTKSETNKLSNDLYQKILDLWK